MSEFERLYYDDNSTFKQKHWDALCAYQDQQYKKGGIEYYRILNKGIQFTNYVGVIQAGNLTIEILPKTDSHHTTASNLNIKDLEEADNVMAQKKQRWHDVLMQMLKECKILKVNYVNYANLHLKSNSILDIYVEIFVEGVEKLLREGLVKKYRNTEDNAFAMKGQLLFSKNIANNLIHKERFYIRYEEYNRNHIFNQILYKALCLVPYITYNSFLTDKVGRLLLDFPEMPDCEVTDTVFDKLIYDRKTERYKDVMHISKMLLLNYSPDIKSGNEHVIAILFDMNKLWEEFIYRRLKKTEDVFKIRVHRQQSSNFWKSDSLYWSKTIRPDIVLTKDAETMIVDTKWKIIDMMVPADDDLKQMFTYNLFWNCKKSILLYPGNDDRSSYGDYHDYKETKQYHSKCAIEIVNIFDLNQRLDKNLADKILHRIFALR